MQLASVNNRDLIAAVQNHDLQRTIRLITKYIDKSLVYTVQAERVEATNAVIAAMEAHPRDARVCGLAFGALTHTSQCATEAAIPAAAIVRVAKAHEDTHLLVVQAASRLLAYHVAGPRGLDALPSVADAGARWLEMYPTDRDAAYWCAVLLANAAGQEPHRVKATHGSFGCDCIDTAVVRGAVVATGHVELTIEGEPWNTWVLRLLYPRLRDRRRPVLV